MSAVQRLCGSKVGCMDPLCGEPRKGSDATRRPALSHHPKIPGSSPVPFYHIATLYITPHLFPFTLAFAFASLDY